MKSGPFHEHSRYLFDMSSVADWSKVNKGLMKMFQAEVLHKFPVIQHFLFGSLLSLDIPEAMQHEAESTSASMVATSRPKPSTGPTSTWGGPVPQRPGRADLRADMMHPAAMSPGGFLPPGMLASSSSTTLSPAQQQQLRAQGGSGPRIAESGSLRKPAPKPE